MVVFEDWKHRLIPTNVLHAHELALPTQYNRLNRDKQTLDEAEFTANLPRVRDIGNHKTSKASNNLDCLRYVPICRP